jgi:alpha-tubulin suppressor-like RCC1 family protein
MEQFHSKPTIISTLNNQQVVDISAGECHSLACCFKHHPSFHLGSNQFGQSRGRGDVYDDLQAKAYLQQFRY